MFKRVLIAAAVLIASPAFVSAQDIFWSFSPTEVTSTYSTFGDSGSAYIFSDGLFGFDAIDLDFATSDSDVIRFTGGEAFNPTFAVVGGTRFNSSEITIDSDGSSGNIFPVNITQNGVIPALGPLADPSFDAGVGPNGAVLLARVDFDIVGFGNADFEFTLGDQGAVQLPDSVLNPSFGSASLTEVPLKVGNCLGDVNLSGTFPFSNSDIDFFDIAPFIAVLASGSYQFEADCNYDNVVNFLDITPFVRILRNSSS